MKGEVQMAINVTTSNKDYGHYVLWTWAADVEQQPELRQRQNFHSIPVAQGSLFIQNIMSLEKMICNKGNKPTSHSKKQRHLAKTSVIHM